MHGPRLGALRVDVDHEIGHNLVAHLPLQTRRFGVGEEVIGQIEETGLGVTGFYLDFSCHQGYE